MTKFVKFILHLGRYHFGFPCMLLDDECRIVPDDCDDDYLERLDRRVSEVINRCRAGNAPGPATSGGVDLDRTGEQLFQFLLRNQHQICLPGVESCCLINIMMVLSWFNYVREL